MNTYNNVPAHSFPTGSERSLVSTTRNGTKVKNITMDLVNGTVWSTLLVFSAPFIMSTLLQTLYSTTDTIVVGQVHGSAGLSSVGNGSQLMQMTYMLLIGFSNAGQVLIAQAKGRDDHAALKKIICSLFYLELILSVILGLVVVIFADKLLSLLNTPVEAFVQARYYIVVCGIGIVFTGFYNMVSAVLRGLGDSRHPLIFVAIAVFLNIVLDILFVAGFGMNAFGAALATVIGQMVSVVFSIRFLLGHEEELGAGLSLNLSDIDRKISGKIIYLGIPMGIQAAAIQFSFLFVASMVNNLGVAVSAAFSVMQKIKAVPGVISNSLGLGCASMIGQNLGAKKIDRVNSIVKCGIGFVTISDFIFGIFYLTVPVLCFRIFTQDESVLSYAQMVMFCLAIELPAHFVMPACNNLIAALGFVQLSFVTAILDAIVGRVLLCWFFGIYLDLGPFGFFLGYAFATYVTSIIIFIYYLSGKWKTRSSLI